MDYKDNIRFFDKVKNKTKNITTSHGPNRTIAASKGRYEYIQTNNFEIMIEGNIKKNVISTYMKCDNIPFLWKKFFLIITNNRDYINKYCNRPFKSFDKFCREWYLSHNSDDLNTRVLDDNLNNTFYGFIG